MSKWDKLLKRVQALSGDLRFEELCKVLENCGYEMSRPSGGTSHCIFRKPGRNPITIPRHVPIKKICIELVREAAEEVGREED